MTRANVVNFASTTLAAAITTTVQTSFSVATGTGSAFPTVSTSYSANPYEPQPFIVTIDSELILCSARSGDTFTVYTYGGNPVGRGWAGSTATAHTSGSTVVHAMTSNYLNDLWAVLPNSYNPDVLPAYRGVLSSSTNQYDPLNANPLLGSASQWDDEFNTIWPGVQGSPWTITPLPTNLGGANAGATIDFHTIYRSNLFFRRSDFDTTTWFIYRAFQQISNPYQVMCKFSFGGHMYGLAPDTAPKIDAFSLIVTDASTLSSSTPDPGNAVRVEYLFDRQYVTTQLPSGATQQTRAVSAQFATNTGNSNFTVAQYVPGVYGTRYLMIDYDGVNLTKGWISADGIAWTCIGAVTSPIPYPGPNSIALRYYTENASANSRTHQTVLVDWVRVTQFSSGSLYKP